MTIIPLIFNLGWLEILIIVLVILLLFGATRIPALMRALGKGIKNFKEEMNNPDGDDSDSKSSENEGKKGESEKKD